MIAAVDSFCLEIDCPPMAKARPRFAAQGTTFMPKNYTEWSYEFRRRAREALWKLCRQQIDGPVRIRLLLRGPQLPRGDPDNLLGGVLDALQPTRLDAAPAVIKNDRQVRYPLVVDYEEAPDWSTWVFVEVLPPETKKKGRSRK